MGPCWRNHGCLNSVHVAREDGFPDTHGSITGFIDTTYCFPLVLRHLLFCKFLRLGCGVQALIVLNLRLDSLFLLLLTFELELLL